MSVKFKNEAKTDVVSSTLADVGVEGGRVKAGATVEIRDDLAYAVKAVGLPLVEVEPGTVDAIEAQKAKMVTEGKA